MILKAKERGNAPQLARYLLAMRDNDHVELHEVRGFISDDLIEAFGEADAIAWGTRCEKHLFSMSFNPPEGANASIEDFEKAIEQVEAKLGLEGQPCTIVFHEKDGRRHAHAVWSRIDRERMWAINLNHYKIKLRDVSRQLYLEHGWNMPRGLEDRILRDPLTFTRKEWRQAQRAGLDAKELRRFSRRFGRRQTTARRSNRRSRSAGSGSRKVIGAALSPSIFVAKSMPLPATAARRQRTWPPSSAIRKSCVRLKR
jgi:hypothetical protein